MDLQLNIKTQYLLNVLINFLEAVLGFQFEPFMLETASQLTRILKFWLVPCQLSHLPSWGFGF